jgi:hypothetical protein
MPQFCFMVISKEIQEDQITIKVVQIPYQNMLKLRPVEPSKIIWIDPEINKNEQLKEMFNEAK